METLQEVKLLLAKYEVDNDMLAIDLAILVVKHERAQLIEAYQHA